MGGTVPVVLAVACAVAFSASGVRVRIGRDGSAFGLSAIFVPLVLAYQGWSFWVFRQRLIRSLAPAVPRPRGPRRRQPG